MKMTAALLTSYACQAFSTSGIAYQSSELSVVSRFNYHMHIAVLDTSAVCLQSLESAAHRSQALKKKSVREGVTSNLAAAAEKLLQDMQSNGVIGEFELDSACLSILAKLPSNQQTQVGL